MKLLVIGAVVAAACVAPCAAFGSEASDQLGHCLVENSSPKDQAALMRWMFSALSLNPSLASVASLTAAQREEASKGAGALFNRLMLRDCRKEAVTALKADGSKAIEAAFATLGERAAEQLLSDSASSAELQKLGTYFDEAKWTELAKEAGIK